MILAGDIGGTKTNLAIYDEKNLKVVLLEEFKSKDFSSFEKLINQFLSKHKEYKIKKACFGIAGPIIEQRCKTTNLPWDIKQSDLQEQLNIKNVRLLNDLEATAYGMLYLEEKEFVNLNEYGRDTKGNIAVIAAGTGLGEAILYFDGKDYFPIATEGGHSDFAPLTAQQDELLKWARDRFKGHVSVERIVSGMGISTIYDFLVDSNFALQANFMSNLNKHSDKSAMISKGALEFDDKLCKETMKLFCEIYAAEAGNLALKSMSVGGVLIGGGIAPKILPFLENEVFINTFFSKGRFEELMRGMKIKVALNDKTALLGTARYAMDKL
ncbi:MAG: glucokinase [Halarcobacter sp.]